MAVEHPAQPRQVIIQIGEVTGDECGVGVTREGALQNFDHPRQVDDAGLIVEPPLVGVHQAVVVTIHFLIHPDRISDMQADRHAQLAALFKQGIHARIVGMHSGCVRFAGPQALAFVVNLAHSARSGLVAAFQFLHGRGRESGLGVVGEIEAAPHFEALGIFRILLLNVVKLRAGGHGQDDRLFDANLVYGADPLVDLLRGLGIGMRVHVDDRVLGPRDFRNKDFVDRRRAIVLEQQGLGKGGACGSWRRMRFPFGILGWCELGEGRKSSGESGQVAPLQECSAIHGISWDQRITCAGRWRRLRPLQ